MKKSLIFSLLMPLTACAQSIVSDNPSVDLGQILYYQPTTAIYTLKNATAQPVTITNVDTGCGCTKATYPTEPIPAGSEFKMQVEFDGKLLGHFQRSILITDDHSDHPTELNLKGNVVLEVENFSGDYPITIGNLLANEDYVEFDDVHKGERLVKDIHIMNPTGQYVEPVVMHLPSYIRAEVVPSRLAPRTGGIIRFVLDSRNVRSYGLNQTSVYLAANKGEKVSEDKAIAISTVILPEDIAQDDTRHAMSPHISLSSTMVDMTDFQGKKKKKAEVLITNTGKSDLEISSIQMFTSGLEVTLPKRKLKPNETVKLKITGIADQLKKVRNRPRILMITNDVDQQKVVIEIKKAQ